MGTHKGKIPYARKGWHGLKGPEGNNYSACEPNSGFPCRQHKHREYCGYSQRYIFPRTHTCLAGIGVADALGPRADPHELDHHHPSHPTHSPTPTLCVTQPTPQLHTCSAILAAYLARDKADARKGHVLQVAAY